MGWQRFWPCQTSLLFLSFLPDLTISCCLILQCSFAPRGAPVHLSFPTQLLQSMSLISKHLKVWDSWVQFILNLLGSPLAFYLLLLTMTPSPQVQPWHINSTVVLNGQSFSVFLPVYSSWVTLLTCTSSLSGLLTTLKWFPAVHSHFTSSGYGFGCPPTMRFVRFQSDRLAHHMMELFIVANASIPASVLCDGVRPGTLVWPSRYRIAGSVWTVHFKKFCDSLSIFERPVLHQQDAEYLS